MSSTAFRGVGAARDPRRTVSPGGRGDEELLRRHASCPDPALRSHLAQRFLPLARAAAARYARGGEPFDDLLQVASVGLLKAIDRFDPDRGVPFPAYAMPTIVGELRRYFRDRCWVVRPPRHLQERALRVEQLIGELTAVLDRPPTVLELADRMGLGEEAALEALEAGRGRWATSLAAPVSASSEDELGDHLGNPDEGFALAEHRVVLAGLVECLTDREREVLRLRFAEDLTQEEIGSIVGVSQMHVSRILRQALAKLRLEAATRRR